MQKAVEIVVTHHAEEAAFQWLMRNDAIKQPHYNLDDLIKLDGRVEAHIDGLRIAGEIGWAICEAALGQEEPGEVFAAGVLAFESEDGARIDSVVSAGSRTLANVGALVSSLGFVPFHQIEAWLQHMVNANADPYRYLGVAGYAIHRVDPGAALNKAIADPFPLIRARALRAVGELKRKDLLAALRQHFQSDDEGCRFWSAWSAILLGDHGAVEFIKPFFSVKSPYFERTLQLTMRTLDVPAAQNWLQALAQFPDTLRYVIEGAGVIGDPAFIPWIIKQMENDEVARVAGEAFSMISGVDLAYEDLDGEWPEGFETGPTENPEDEDVQMDPDEDLPWPEPGLIAQWWEKNKHRYPDGVRHLAGKPVAIEHCRQVLKTGFQRQRKAAALELAIRVPGEPLFNTSAPGKRQQQWLAK